MNEVNDGTVDPFPLAYMLGAELSRTCQTIKDDTDPVVLVTSTWPVESRLLISRIFIEHTYINYIHKHRIVYKNKSVNPNIYVVVKSKLIKVRTFHFFLWNLYIVTVCVFVSPILFWFPQRTHYLWHVLRFLFMERKQDYNVTSVKNVKV
jgi:hypothetical protein